MSLQVLSKTVPDALQLENNPNLTETIRFIRKFDKFFYMMNVRSLDESVLKRKPDLRPFRSISDNRFKVGVHKTQTVTSFALLLLGVAKGRLPCLPR